MIAFKIIGSVIALISIDKNIIFIVQNGRYLQLAFSTKELDHVHGHHRYTLIYQESSLNSKLQRESTFLRNDIPGASPRRQIPVAVNR